MSHFSVLVIHREDQRIEDLLAPYNENIEVDRYLDMTRQGAIDYVRNNYSNPPETDDECYNMYVSGIDDDMIDPNTGNIYSTYNPKSKWDWYAIGGRWGGKIPLKKNVIVDDYNEVRIEDIDFTDFTTFAVVTPDGKWHERAKMGFWAVTWDEDNSWDDEYYNRFIKDADPEWIATMVDCHI